MPYARAVGLTSATLRLSTALCALCALALLAPPAQAQPSGEARRLGEVGRRAAIEGRFEAAIAAFKAADAAGPAPEADCNIGLIYAQLAQPHRALFFLERCNDRMPAMPPEIHYAVERTRILEQLEQGGYALLQIMARPSGTAVTLSAFADDEVLMAPATVWVPPGPVAIRAQRAGYLPTTRDVTVPPGGQNHVRLVLTPAPPPPPPPPPPVAGAPAVAPTDQPPGVAPAPDRAAAWITLAAAGALATGGVAMHVMAGVARADSERALRAMDRPGYDAAERRLDWQQPTAYGLYGAAALTAAVGVWLAVDAPEPTTALHVSPGGVAFSTTW